jgi:hypothetical protein
MGRGEYDYEVRLEVKVFDFLGRRAYRAKVRKVFDTWAGVLKYLARMKVSKYEGVSIYRIERR